MKNILFILFFVYSFSFSQTLNSDENGYYKIIKVDSLSKEQIHNKAKEWVVLNYTSANDVIQLDSKDKLIVKGVLKVNYFQFEHIYKHTLIISFKENRFKIELILNSMNTSFSAISIDVYDGYLSVDKEKIFKKFNSDPKLKEGYLKKSYVIGSIKAGVSEKKALKRWEKNKEIVMKTIPQTIDDVDMKPFLENSRIIKKKALSIFYSIESYFNKKSSEDKW